MKYGDKRDYPKIDLYYDGNYRYTTTWAKNLKEAKNQYIEQFHNLIIVVGQSAIQTKFNSEFVKSLVSAKYQTK